MAVSTTTALVLTALAAAGSAYNTNQVAKKQDNAAADGIRAQGENQRQTNARLNKTIDQMKASDSKGAKESTSKQYLQRVQASLANANAGLGQRGLVADFDERAGGAAAANEDYGNVTADLMARMDAPLNQRLAEGKLMSDTGMDLSVIGGNVQGQDFLTRMRMGGIRRNGYIDAASGVMNGIAAGGGGAGGAAGSAQYIPVANGGRAVYAAGGTNSGLAYT